MIFGYRRRVGRLADGPIVGPRSQAKLAVDAALANSLAGRIALVHTGDAGSRHLPTDPVGGFDEQHPRPQPRRLHGGGKPTGAPAGHHHIVLVLQRTT